MMKLTLPPSAVSVRTASAEAGEFRLRYSLFRTGSGARAVYSLSVLLEAPEGDEGAEILDLTRDPFEANRLFDLVSGGGVTPCTLRDVLEDLL